MDKFAIIGISIRVPGANNPKDFLNNLLAGRNEFRKLTEDEINNSPYRDDDMFVPVTSGIENPFKFDAHFFEMNEREARITDPQQRLFLKCCYEALEDGGITGDKSKRIGVFASVSQSSYLINNLNSSNGKFDYQISIGNEPGFCATRVSYKLNLTGPSLTVQSGCSSSLTGLKIACQNIKDKSCDLALVGGASISFPLSSGYSYKEGTTFSRSGHLRPFDKQADGMIKGDGCGVIVIERLSQATREHRHVYAIIDGVGINNDGNEKVGYTAPSIRGEQAAISSAIDQAGISSDDIDYIETHGTGTSLGDPIEIQALNNAYQFTKRHMIGSVKANIGHLDSASGIIGIIKTALALDRGVIPKSIGFRDPNPQARMDKNNVYVEADHNVELSKGEIHYAGVSSFGIGGTNVHVILESPTVPFPSMISIDHPVTIRISARTIKDLKNYKSKLISFLKSNNDISLFDVAKTLNEGRKKYRYIEKYQGNNIKDIICHLSNNITVNDTETIGPGNYSICQIFIG